MFSLPRFLNSKSARSLGILCLMSAPAAGKAMAQSDVADFYRGKTITIGVGATPGGGYDLDARVLSRHLGKHVPGNPGVVVQNVPGARGLTQVNRLYASARRDGTMMGVVQRGLLTAPWLNPQGIQFDVMKFNWLFSTAAEPGVAIMWHTSGIQTVGDIQKREGVIGGAGDSAIIPQVYNFTAGTRFRIVSGYPGTADVVLAMERGEVQGIGYYSWSNIASKNPEWVTDKKIRILFQTGEKRHADLPDVPLISELATSDEMRQVQDLWLSPLETARPYAMPPEVPQARVEAVRKAFFDMLKDPEFREDARKTGMLIDPRTHSEIEAILKRVSSSPQSIIETARRAVVDK
jgi:tripartite-type tricarboxylate transporter receptor subunit TctC